MHANDGTPTLNFVRHYVEMLVAMFLGMFVLGAAAGLLGLAGVDVSAWRSDAPALLLLGMAATMSAPMVAWMRHRGHGWALCWEMTAAMFLPSLAAIALLWGGLVEDSDTLLAIQHIAMFPSMLVAMLLRRAEYTRHVGRLRAAA
jgi:flagellar biosynthetic protein FliP